MNDDFKNIRSQLGRVRLDRDTQESELLRARARVAQIDRELAGIRRVGGDPERDNRGRQLLAERADRLAEVENRRAELAGLRQDVSGLLDQFADLFTKPQTLIEQLDDVNPILLLPVRLETKFMNRGGQHELWVRIFPDDIAIETHEVELTAEEVKAGSTYWEQVWRAGGDETLAKGAWRVLVSHYGDERAAWIARAMRPTNDTPANRPPAPVDAGTALNPAPVFPTPPAREGSWTRAPRVRVLPDRFVILTYVGGTRVHEEVGRPIPDPLIVGPDPSQEAPSILPQDDTLVFDENIDWLVDFDRAVAVGMGVRIRLTPEQAAQGFDRVLALGIRFASDEADSIQRLAGLFESHHYTHGLSLAPQGTPTNNTEGGAAGYSRADDSDTSYVVEQGGPLFTPVTDDPFNRPDGQIVADALRLPYDVFQHVRHADGQDMIEARAMNTALFPATLGYFMEEMMKPVFSLETIRQTREYFTRLVSGRGAVPALRVGRQPYGILPATVYSRLKLSERQVFFRRMQDVLREVETTWTTLSRQVAHAGDGGDPEAQLLNMLGLHASSVEFHQRFAPGPDYHWNLMMFLNDRGFAEAYWDYLRQAGMRLIERLGYAFPETPKIFTLNFFTHQTLLDGPLVDSAALSEMRSVEPIGEGLGNYIEWLLNSDIDTIRREDFGTDGDGARRPAPDALLYLLLRHALLLEYWDTTMKVLVARDVVPLAARREVELLNMNDQPDVTRWDYLDAVVPSITGTVAMRDFLFTTSAAALAEARELQEVRDALGVLAGLPTARLERLLAEHLDLCSYRLDAWLLGLVNLRLYEMDQRRSGPQTGTTVGTVGRRSTGIYIGAFGWLEDLRPRAARQPAPPAEIPAEFEEPNAQPLEIAPDNAGYMHMPSLTHAETAAILRNAYLTHADPSEREQMTVNLSSERVRRALGYFEGIRHGQPLGALLGYQFERGLHDRNATLRLDQYILPLRKRFPLDLDPRIPQPTGTPDESIAARNVVDGLKLVRAARSQAYPYGVSGLPANGTPEAQAIQTELERVRDSLDAVGDLALAEGVFQVARGNFTRASAALDALSKGGFPPEPEVVETPRGGTTVTHRVILSLPENADASAPWAGVPASPRATTEPRLNHWLGRLLGDPTAIRCQVSYVDLTTSTETSAGEVSLRDLNLQPIDYLYLSNSDLAGEATELEARIAYVVRRRVGLPQETLVRIDFIQRNAGWSIDVKSFFEALALVNPLRELITGCRALNAEDFIPPGEVGGSSGDRYGYQIAPLRSRVTAARDALQTARDALETARAAADVATFTAAEVDALRAALLALAQFGVPDCVPLMATETDAAARDELVLQAVRILAVAGERLAAATTALGMAAGSVDEEGGHLLTAARAVFGDAFKLLPLFDLQSPAQLQTAYDNRATLLVGAPPLAVERWLQGLTYVRPKLAALDTARTIAETFDSSAADVVGVEVVQAPYLADDRWLALPLTAGQTASSDKLSLLVQSATPVNASVAQSGLLIDEWVEVIPGPDVTTGLAFHFDQPNSEPPQAMLLVVPPDFRGHWTWNDLVDTLHETLDLAKKRAVEPDQLAHTPYAHLLPAIMTATTQFQSTISLDLARNVGVLWSLSDT